ncbi:hypothetical protein POM88_006605 [Heracleum sosnowskyi]|uniref:SWIM-type domain-containing protein n=1 Tax=Heracleum sosnowskyi TaxID=360622 RepID=A0AAD8J2W6_9APIA|nr:hypothetical protein POM88_006605 [Heracleum sosnowskyi]
MITEDLLRISSNQGVSSVDSSHLSRLINDSVSDCANGSTDHSNSTVSDDAISKCTFTPGGRRYYVPISIDEACIPVVNKLFDSMEEGMEFYQAYGRLSGFNTRRSTEKTDDDANIVSKYVVCSRAGFNEKKLIVSNKKSSQVKRRRTVSNRCGCGAKIILRVVSGKTYRISMFVEEHNHDLVPKSGRQFMRVNRQMSIISRKFVFDAANVNIGVSKSHSFMKEQVGGYANVGATVRDFRNFSRDLKAYVGERDAQMIINKFKAKHASCESFYYAYDVDSEDHLTKLFWADAVARRNYELYGDAVSFDATFDTNMYNMVFCPFTGCPAMKQAIPISFAATDEFPATRHRLCMWHIMEKFPMKLGNYLCKETDFMEKMKKYIWSSTLEPAEFEKGWTSVLKEFKLEGNRWLWEMFAIRTSWIPAFFRDKPMFGLMRTTSRSESENNFFSQFHRQSDSLCEFYLRFGSAMDRQRYEYARLNQEDLSAIPSTVSKLFIEADAAQLYTRPIFYKIQQEILASCYDMRIQDIGPLVDGVKCYIMKDVLMKDKLFEVKVSQNHADCSCKKFVMCGILCRHAFCALNHFEVVKIPRLLVLNRWSRTAENRPSSSKLIGVSDDFRKMENVSLMVSNIWFSFQKSMNKAGVDVEKLSYVDKVVKQLNSDLGDGSGLTKKAHMEVMMGPQPTEDITIHAPNQCKNKGSGFKRFVSQREKAIKEGNKRARKCKICQSSVHDARTCPRKNDSNAGDAEKNKSSTEKNKSSTADVTGEVEVDSGHED